MVARLRSSHVVRWAAVGVLGFVVQSVVLWTLVRLVLMPLPVATALAVASAVVHNYCWHERWTWADRSARGALERIVRFGKFCGVAGFLSVLGNAWLTTMVASWWDDSILIANLTAVLTLAVANWLLADSFVFAPRAGAALVIALMCPTLALGAELRHETVAAWERAVQETEARMAIELSRSAQTGSVLWPMDQKAVLEGNVHVESLASGDDPPDGTLHHWRASIHIPGVTLDQVLAELQSADASRHVQADVLEWRLLAKHGDAMRVFLRMRREEVVTVVYNSEHDVRYRRHGPAMASSRSASLRIAEVRDAGTRDEREQPVGNDRGFLWRMNSYWRYQERADGVLVQVESMTLSRAVPVWLSPVATPIIKRIARESLVRTLEAVRTRMGPK